MKILAIETSCDETAIALVEASTIEDKLAFRVLGNSVSSQAELHSEFGGVFPALAKREHTKNILPVLIDAVGGYNDHGTHLTEAQEESIRTIFAREPELCESFLEDIKKISNPQIDCIAVTTGPGLEPALWVGIVFAKALSVAWDTPLVPINHMEGHILSPLLLESDTPENLFPALSLLISGGHTEIVVVEGFGSYARIGETRDDAVGEAFDKVARMLDLSYPGGPKISKLAHEHREQFPDWKPENPLPRPMLKSPDYDFSFSGLKTAVLYRLRDFPDSDKAEIARDFEDAVTEILIHKTFKALVKHNSKVLLVGGGVSANTHIKKEFLARRDATHPYIKILFPTPEVTTDNAIMIAMAGYIEYQKNKNGTIHDAVLAEGSLRL